MSDETKLLPCPFCGGEADPKEVAFTKGEDPTIYYHPACTECGAEAHSVEIWNTRVFKNTEQVL